MINRIDSHGLSVGDRVVLNFTPIRPPWWALWRWPAYRRQLKLGKDGGVYVVTDVVSSSE